MITGACNCGAVAYELVSKPLGVFICHCSICRRSTGTNGNAVLIIDNDDFRWTTTTKTVSTWQKPGHDWQTWFCSTCGSQLPGENDEQRMFVPAGSISNYEDLAVIHHIWVDSKASWDKIGDDGQQHAEAFKG